MGDALHYRPSFYGTYVTLGWVLGGAPRHHDKKVG
jgi:hypothetical protein